jgi:hypothetical protein
VLAGVSMKPRNWKSRIGKIALGALLENLDDPMGARFDQNRAAVHDRVAIVPNAIFRWHVIIGDARFGQHRADPDRLVIFIGRAALLDHIAVEAGTLIDAEHPGHTTHHAADDTADHGTDRTGRAFALAGASLYATRDPVFLGLSYNRKRNGGDEGSNSDKTTDHDHSSDVG